MPHYFIVTAKQDETEGLQSVQLPKNRPAQNPRSPCHRQVSQWTQGAVAARQGGIQPALMRISEWVAYILSACMNSFFFLIS